MSTHVTNYSEIIVQDAEAEESGPVTINAATYVIAGDYLETPDLVIRVEHAVDAEGNDIRNAVGRFIAGRLQDLDTLTDPTPETDR